jgi:bifunctional ADP-heptose synthase (sugar kinase/adenylyltransferase)
VIVHEMPMPKIPTPRKTRYIAVDKSQRIFEITDLRSDQWSGHSEREFSKLLIENSKGMDSVVMADFGHGLFEGEVLNSIQDIKPFLGLNVQTNSSNYGFNIFRKHKRFDYLSLDTREVRMAYHDRYSPPVDLGRQAAIDLNPSGKSVSMTLGSNGSYYFSAKSRKEYFSPAFADNVVDATGAGDAFFCLTSVLLKAECPGELIPFLGNVFAGLKTKIIGNKHAVTKPQLMKAVGSILK